MNHNLRHQSNFSTRSVKRFYYGTELLGYLGVKIWELVPAQIGYKKRGSQKSVLADSVRHTFTKWASFKISILSFYF